MARPQKPIDPVVVRELAGLQLSYEEMSVVLQCDPSTLTRRFAQVIKEGRENGKTSLKRKQFLMAMDGNTAMCIWLGKQWLGQKDKTELSGDAASPIVHKTENDDKSTEAILGILKDAGISPAGAKTGNGSKAK